MKTCIETEILALAIAASFQNESGRTLTDGGVKFVLDAVDEAFGKIESEAKAAMEVIGLAGAALSSSFTASPHPSSPILLVLGISNPCNRTSQPSLEKELLGEIRELRSLLAVADDPRPFGV